MHLLGSRSLSLFLCGAILAAGCAVNPVTGQQELMLLSEQDERQLGQQTDATVVEQYGIYEDPVLQDYIRKIGMPMAQNSHRPDLAWEFKVMDSPVINAFAAPGGYLYVTRGLLGAVNSEAELAGIIGHEIGHVTARHSAQQYSKQVLTSLGVNLGVSVAGNYGDMLGPLLEAGTGLLFLKFSRDDEREADRLGVEYSSRAGYDASRLSGFFQTLQTMPGEEGGEAGGLPEFFSTHPNPADRQLTVQQLAHTWQRQLPGQIFRVNRDGYLERLDGLIYGPDPRRGFRAEDTFYLPQYGVQFRIPPDWQFARRGERAQMVAPDRNGLVLFDIEEDSAIDQAVDRFLAATGAKVLQSEALAGRAMPGRQVVSVIEQEGRRGVLVSSFFQQQRRVFMFHGLAGAQNFEALSGRLQLPAQSFGPIDDPAKANPQPQRLRINRLDRPTTLRTLLQQEQIAAKLWDEIAWLNGMSLDQAIPAGERVKLVK